jgi:P4 family phage/plasmid primase-like protien
VQHLCKVGGQPAPEVERYVLGDIGAALFGHTREQATLLFIGAPASGKSTLARVLQPILGAGLVTTVMFEQLWGEKPDPTTLAKLQGKRLITIAEVEGKGDTRRFKSTTGQDPLSYRIAYATADIEFAIMGRIIGAGNSLPVFYDASGAIERRMRIINVEQKVLIENPDMDAMLIAERPGILGLLVTMGAYHIAQVSKPDLPQSISEAAKAHRQSSDPVAKFITEHCAATPGSRTKVLDRLRRQRELLRGGQTADPRHGHNKPPGEAVRDQEGEHSRGRRLHTRAGYTLGGRSGCTGGYPVQPRRYGQAVPSGGKFNLYSSTYTEYTVFLKHSP